MREFSLLKSIPCSLFSAKLYKDVGKNWKGLGFIYLLIVLSICWVLTSLNFLIFLEKIDDDESSKVIFKFVEEGLSPDRPFSTEEQLNRTLAILSEFPDVIIENGKADILSTVPHIIKDPETEHPLIIFDDSGEYTSLQGTGAVILMTDSRITISGGDEERSYYISEWDTEEQKGVDALFFFMSQLPKIEINNGIASADVEQPYFMSMDEANHTELFVIDTTGKHQILNKNQDAAFLLTKTEFFYKYFGEGATEYVVEKFPLSEVNNENFLLGIGLIVDMLKDLTVGTIIISLPFAIIFSFIFYIICALLYAMIGLIFSFITRSNLEYTDIVRLTSVCLTPSLILQTISTNSWNINISGWILFAVTTVYLLFAVISNRKSNDEESGPSLRKSL